MTLLLEAGTGEAQTMPQDAMETVAAGNNTSHPKLRTSHRAAAAAANAFMAAQVQEEAAPLGVVMAKALGPKPVKHNTLASSTTPAQEQQDNMEMLLCAALGDEDTKKRASEAAAPAPKRAKVTNRSMVQTTQQNAEPRGKKRRQAPVYEAPMEASPIITDLPPLPFTTPDVAGKYKKKYKIRKVAPLKETETDDSRHCEFCKKVANICVLLHCHACRRVYHAGCFLHAFKPLVDAQTPILDQMERLQLEAPERRGNIFRCASCKAAFLDFYESGGYLWDCDCPTCLAPEKQVYYRQRKLVQMMNDLELEKQRKKEKKGQKSGAAKTPVPTPSRSSSAPRSRRTRGSSATPDYQVVNSRTSRSRGVSPEEKLKKEVENESKDEDSKVESMDVDGGLQASGGDLKPEDDQNTKPQLENSDEKKETFKVNEAVGQQPQNQPQVTSSASSNEPAVPQHQAAQTLKAKYDLVDEAETPDLTGDELVQAVRVQHDEKSGGWSFPVMCSRTSSLHVSGIMKTGSCKWFPKKMAFIQCDCCAKLFKFSEFVHHTDSSLVKDAKCADEDPMPFLFVEHRDTTQHSPLEDFQPALRSWVGRQSANNTPTKSRKGRAMKPEAVVPPTIPEPEVDAAMSRLRTLALFKRPKHRSDNSSTAARLTDPATFDFVVQVVCLSPKYVMNMANGSLADRVVRSKTPVPGDSFPRKAGWMAFNRTTVNIRQITCVCCEKKFSIDDFVAHAGISQTELTKTPRKLLYVVERQDESALMPFLTFAKDLDAAATNNVVDALLSDLHPPPPSPRPLEL
ncbi:hypothetical protein JG687_00012315 [Phytophthora cactorum]|uniref:Tify domain-containing protein n=1 Tax=Phytophthora cactorum TaxID=29920 RepID=A0A8T1U5Y3_9STRA|nr:hypothetical protein PC123_g19671 [Phytophthora cactorum]KAG6953582.1 hypothetical protein JG687_00012315 [Phytophthora cactorum]